MNQERQGASNRSEINPEPSVTLRMMVEGYTFEETKVIEQKDENGSTVETLIVKSQKHVPANSLLIIYILSDGSLDFFDDKQKKELAAIIKQLSSKERRLLKSLTITNN